MEYRAEGAQRVPTSYTLDALRRAMTAGDILESRALSFDSEKRLHFRLGEIEATRNAPTVCAKARCATSR